MNSISITKEEDLSESFFSSRRLADSVSVVPQVLEDVRQRGDIAIRDYAAKFDKANPYPFEISKSDLKACEEKLKITKPDFYKALCHSRDLAMQFAKKQRESFNNFDCELSPGLITGQRNIPVERAGVYTPAGRFPLFSSVIMGVVPAKAAGVKEVILCTPPMPHPAIDCVDVNNLPKCGDYPSSPVWANENILAVASLCGVDRVFAVGGSQAIAAMAYGTQSVPKVQVIVGPGNKFVAAAKKLVYGDVGIDMLAGPTEVLVIADDSANPKWVAADLLAQAEHDPDAQAILVTPSINLAKTVQAEVDALVSKLPTDAVATKSFKNNGMIILTKDLMSAATIANKKAPEHLELALDAGSERDTLENSVFNYGSLFVGHRSAEVLGDYAAGLNHTLPTCGSAMFTGGLSVRTFFKTVTVLHTKKTDDKAALSGWNESLKTANELAKAEGLTGHALAAQVRIN